MGAVQLATPPASAGPSSAPAAGGRRRSAAGRGAVAGRRHALLALGVDEYQMYLYVVRGDARVEIHKLSDGSWARDSPSPGSRARR